MFLSHCVLKPTPCHWGCHVQGAAHPLGSTRDEVSGQLSPSSAEAAYSRAAYPPQRAEIANIYSLSGNSAASGPKAALKTCNWSGCWGTLQGLCGIQPKPSSEWQQQEAAGAETPEEKDGDCFCAKGEGRGLRKPLHGTALLLDVSSPPPGMSKKTSMR